MTAETATARPRPTITDIRQACRAYALDSAALCKATGHATVQATSDQEAACDEICSVGLWWLKRHARHARRRQDMPTEEHFRDRFMGDCAATALNLQVPSRQIVGSHMYQQSVGIGLIMGALLSWLIGRVLTWIWDWWTRDQDAAAVVGAME